ncbi:MAG: hypothetical protein JWO24_2121, partial [Rhodospirillales bacterium]|nr:hypothetical protein [Rhodospirillales bacterium]
AGLVREAGALAGAAAALRNAVVPLPGAEAGDVRRVRGAMSAVSDAAARATLALEAADAMGQPDDVSRVKAIREAAKRMGLGAAMVAPMLRVAALSFVSDDASARVAAEGMATAIAAALEGVA